MRWLYSLDKKEACLRISDGEKAADAKRMRALLPVLKFFRNYSVTSHYGADFINDLRF